MKAYELKWRNKTTNENGVIFRGCYSDCLGWGRNNFCTVDENDTNEYRFFIQHPEGLIEDIHNIRIVRG